MGKQINYDEVKNKVCLEGWVEKEPELHHTTFSEGIYEIVLRVPRLTEGVFDYIRVDIPDRLMDLDKLVYDSMIHVEGQFRSFNRKDENIGKAHLELSVFAKDVYFVENVSKVNKIEIEGFLCKEPVYRVTPLGREICDLLVAVNRLYGKSDYIPSIAWGRNARFSSNLDVGSGVSIEGRIQSREYKKKISEDNYITKTAYEVSASRLSVFQEVQKED